MNYVVSVYSYGGSVQHYDFTNFKKARSFAWQRYRFLRSQCDSGDYGELHVTISCFVLGYDYSMWSKELRRYA